MKHAALRVCIVVILSWCAASCFKKNLPNEYALLHQRACIESLSLKDHVRAQTHCELCLEYEASMPECLNGIGLIALINNDEDKAKSYFTKALRQNNDFSQARNNLGVIYFAHGDFHEALRYFDRALEIDPSNLDARYNAGLSQFRIAERMKAADERQGLSAHLLRAKDQLKKLVAIEPSYHIAFRDLGLIDLNLAEESPFEQKQQELIFSAKKSFELCLEGNKEEDGCYEGLGQAYFLQGHFDKAFANYFMCLSFAPNNSACRASIAIAYEQGAKSENGYQSFKNALAAAPANASAHEAFCGALFERSLDEEAVRECELALRLDPKLCRAHFHLGDYYAQTLQVEKAVQSCQAFLHCGTVVASKETQSCQEILTTIRRQGES